LPTQTLPNTLILHLKRFEFNFDTMHKVKLNDYCEFPDSLDMFPYTREGLASMEKEHEQKAKPIEESLNEEESAEGGGKQKQKKDIADNTGDGEKEEDTAITYEIRPKEYYEYELMGILVHRGVADSGHYYSYIKVPRLLHALPLSSPPPLY